MKSDRWTQVSTNGTRLLALALVTALAAPSWAEDLQSQFLRFLSWWPGTYDSQADGVADGAPTLRLHLQPVTLPAFGDEVIYGEWQNLEKNGLVTRQRFYSFEVDDRRQALRLNLHIFPLDQEFARKTQGAHRDPSRIAGLTPDEMFPLAGCDVFFTWQGDHFAGAMDRGSCAFKAPGTDDDIYSWSQMRLRDHSFEYLDAWYNLDGSLYRAFGEHWTVFQRR